jgi:hypothetical protein
VREQEGDSIQPLRQAIARLDRWLLGSGIQVEAGPELGGVGGWLDGCGRPPFIYMESTGYYLSWLAFLLSRDHSDRARIVGNATLAIGWLRRNTLRGQLPPTRRYLCDRPPADWRNFATFTFDIGMVV